MMGIRRSKRFNAEVYTLYQGVFGVACNYNDGRLAYYYHGDTEHIEYTL